MLSKKLIVYCIMLMILSYGLNAQEIDKNKLTVFGKVRVFAQTDRATISFNIEGVGKTLENAFSDANGKIHSISEKLFEIGLNENDLVTSMFKNKENFGNKAFLSSKRDFKTTMSASVVTDSLELLEDIIIILSKSDIEIISNISFELVDYSKLRMDAFKKAAAKAKEKAEMISELLGIKLGNVIEFEQLKPEKVHSSSPLISNKSNPFNAPIILQDYNRKGGWNYAEEIQFDSEVKLVYEILDNMNDETNN